MNFKGFCFGKVLVFYVKKMFGKDIMGEVVQVLVQEISQKVIEDVDVCLVGQFEMYMESDMEKVFEGEEDFVYYMYVDIMLEFELVDIKKLIVKKLVVEINDDEVDVCLIQIVEVNLKYDKCVKIVKVCKDDVVVIDFLGKFDGELFEGGVVEEYILVFGFNLFIFGFEDQLIGVKVGDEKDVEVMFFEQYQVEYLVGKEVVFEVKVYEVWVLKMFDLDEEFVIGFGFESFDKLKEFVIEQLKNEFGGVLCVKVKCNLFDIFDEKYDFDLLLKMVEQEFGQIWQQVQVEMDVGWMLDEDKDKFEDDLKEEYGKIVECCVCFGLVLVEIGCVVDVKIDEQEVQQVLICEVCNFLGQECQVIEFFQKDLNVMVQLCVLIYEDKVVDYILEIVKVKEEIVFKEDLLKEDED